MKKVVRKKEKWKVGRNVTRKKWIKKEHRIRGTQELRKENGRRRKEERNGGNERQGRKKREIWRKGGTNGVKKEN